MVESLLEGSLVNVVAIIEPFLQLSVIGDRIRIEIFIILEIINIESEFSFSKHIALETHLFELTFNSIN